ncbi:folate-binding protein [[Haemophilus] felis]|nr:folate-binding protein [[Haemophilus] felis]
MDYELLTKQKNDIICQLEQFSLIQIQGDDAEKYLQGQLTCDVTKLAIGESTLTAHCDAKGKVTSLFRLIRAEQGFYLLLKKSLLENALAQLKKYAVFSKVSFTELNWEIIGLAGDKIIEVTDHIAAEIRLELDTKQPRVILINPISLDLKPNLTANTWDLLDIQDGIPNLDPKTQNEFIPQSFNLQDIEQAISFQKGCYIGQETVARAKYRGINKRAMFTLVGKTNDIFPTIGSEVEIELETNWRKTGTILNAENINGELWLQVILNTPIEENCKFRLSEQVPLQLLS